MTSQETSNVTFAEATKPTQIDSHNYLVDFRDSWSIGTVPHGGYVTSCFLQVARLHFSTTLSSQSQPDTIAIHLDFLRRTEVGPAHFSIRDVKLGRQTSVIHITLTQGPVSSRREEVVAYITNSHIAKESGISLDTNFHLLPPPPKVDLQRLARDEDELWARQRHMPFASFRKATQRIMFHFPRAGQAKGVADQWTRLATGEKFTNATLGYLSDMFTLPMEAFREDVNPYDVAKPGEKIDPSKTVNKTAMYWFPTLLLNLDVKKALPEGGVEWLFSRLTVKSLKNGRMDLEVVIMDEAGDLVAISNHIALILGAERNTASRRQTKI